MPIILRATSVGAAWFSKVVSLSGGLTLGSTLESENHREDSFGTQDEQRGRQITESADIFGWGHPFQTIQSMPSNMPQM